MVGLHSVVCVLLGVMDDVEQQFLDHPSQWGGQVGGDLGGPAVSAQRGLEESPCRRRVSPPGRVDVDDPTALVNGAVHVAPLAGDLDVGLINEPAVPDTAAARTSSLDQ
jgi:hypothetical protein